MKKLLVATLMVASFHVTAIADTTNAGAEADAVTAQDVPVWYPEEAAEIRFDVLRKGKPFGSHVLTFAPQEDGTLQVVNDIELTAKIGPFTAYKYRHDSTEIWTDGALTSLIGETRKDGEDLVASATAEGDVLAIEGTNFVGTAPASVIPSSHWHSREVFSSEILSSEGGQLLDVETEDMGRETLTIAGQQIEATKFKLVSDLTVYLWYDDTGRWVKCAFSARGQDIEYVLQALY